jgi:hypothetical protein
VFAAGSIALYANCHRYVGANCRRCTVEAPSYGHEPNLRTRTKTARTLESRARRLALHEEVCRRFQAGEKILAINRRPWASSDQRYAPSPMFRAFLNALWGARSLASWISILTRCMDAETSILSAAASFSPPDPRETRENRNS